MIPYILCYKHPFVELLRPTTPSFQIRTHNPQFSNQIDAAVALCIHDTIFCIILYVMCCFIVLSGVKHLSFIQQ